MNIVDIMLLILPVVLKKYKTVARITQTLRFPRPTHDHDRAIPAAHHILSSSPSKMKAQAILITALLAMGASADCIDKFGRRCQWFGSSPFCGSTSSNINDVDSDGRILTWTTQRQANGFLYQYGFITEDCFNDYGYPCIAGYKRLWCYQ
ncbi:hypothetical protein F5X68DRAFT_211550 [Plectosphaerella plurivora]|uniref:Uncharacterized protein n=1 Tax=Plectosphaerella plurivora TaxID=936078 RepID=A0A9P9A9S7_9PEZI|nr:hypothetical protein F5X68DRAFT_211550 [Plectosphaerella plurivora]